MSFPLPCTNLMYNEHCTLNCTVIICALWFILVEQCLLCVQVEQSPLLCPFYFKEGTNFKTETIIPTGIGSFAPVFCSENRLGLLWQGINNHQNTNKLNCEKSAEISTFPRLYTYLICIIGTIINSNNGKSFIICFTIGIWIVFLCELHKDNEMKWNRTRSHTL